MAEKKKSLLATLSGHIVDWVTEGTGGAGLAAQVIKERAKKIEDAGAGGIKGQKKGHG